MYSIKLEMICLILNLFILPLIKKNVQNYKESIKNSSLNAIFALLCTANVVKIKISVFACM